MKKAYMFYLIVAVLAIVSVISIFDHNRRTAHGDFAVITDEGSRIFQSPLQINPQTPNDIEFEFQPKTNRWFLSSKLPDLDFITEYKKPGDTINLPLAYIFNNKNWNRSENQLRITLTLRDKDWQLAHNLEEHIFNLNALNEDFVFEAKLLNEEDAGYLLSAEIMGKEGIEDTLLKIYYIPPQEVNATLILDKQQYKSSDILKLTIINNGPTIIQTDGVFTIESFLGNDVWIKYPLETLITHRSVDFKPSWAYEQYIPLKSIEKGDYRIVKIINGVGTDIEKKMIGLFTIY